MLRPALILTALVLALTPAVANATVLYTTMDQANDVQGINSDSANLTNWLAQSFTPTQSGPAHLVSFFAQTQLGTGAGVGTVAIHSDNAGKPGARLGSGSGPVNEQTGASPTCVALDASPTLTAGTKYWAVLHGGLKTVNWMFWRNAAKPGLYSITSGVTWLPRDHKTFSLRVDSGPACGPSLKPNPVANTELGDMYAKPGTSSFNTLFIGNSGNQSLTLTGGFFTGPNASSFRLLKGEPTGPENVPFEFPFTIGATSTAGAILYITCDGSLPEGQRTATFTLTSDDPAQGAMSWPVWCLVDKTPPSLQFSDTPDGRAGWHASSPATVTVSGIDPESGNRVKAIACTDSNGPNLNHNSGSVAQFNLTAQGTHNLACQGTDVANNTGTVGQYKKTVKLDSVAPNATKGAGPAAVTASASQQFTWSQSDATSGVQEIECSLDGIAYAACTSPATRSSLADGMHKFEVRVRDVAGSYDATPARWDWRVDTTAPNTALGGGVASPTKATSATFTVTGSDTGGSGVNRVLCSLDGAPEAKCPAPATYSNLAEGHHTLTARAVDNAGNTDSSAAEAAWDIDRTAPAAVFTEHPSVLTAETTASFAFVAEDAGPSPVARFECRLDGAAFSTCTSPVALDSLAGKQEHAFEVRAVDTLGNAQATPTKFTWTIDEAPHAADDSSSTTANTPIEIAVLANDLDPRGATLTLELISATSGNGGELIVTAAGVRYVPAKDFVGTDTFAYRVRNADGLESAIATVTVVVGPAQPGPGGNNPPPTGASSPLAGLLPGAGSNPVITGAPAADRTSPVITKAAVKRRRLSFTLSEAAKTTVTIQQRAKRTGKLVTRATRTLAGKPGANVLRIARKLLKGRYRIKILAVDAAGNRSKLAVVNRRTPL